MPEHRVVVEVHLRVEREEIAVFRHDQRIDFQQRRIGGDEGVVERRHDFDRLADLRPLEAEREGELARLVRGKAETRVDVFLEDLLGRLLGDLLDLDAAFLADHQREALARAIQHDAEVQLALDPEALLD